MLTERLTIRRVLKASRARVFAAWTRPDLVARWFFPGSDWSATFEHDFRVGGRWQVEMKDAAGALHEQFGEYREIAPDARLVFTWNCPHLAVTDSVVTIQLRDHAGGTELVLEHELPSDPKVLSGHQEGWDGCLANFERLLNATAGD